jgi:hypothetical protein
VPVAPQVRQGILEFAHFGRLRVRPLEDRVFLITERWQERQYVRGFGLVELLKP